MSGHGEGHAGPETNESDPGLGPSECFDSMFDFEQWEADQEVRWELHQDLQGLSSLASSGDEGPNITSLTPQSSSIDFDLEEPLRTTTPVSTIVPTTVSANIESLSCLGVPSWDFVSTPDHNSISLPSTHLVDSPDIASGTDGAEVPLRQQSLPSGYSGDYSNQTTGDHNAFSKDPSVERQSDVGVGVGSYVIRPKQSLPHSKKGSRTKSHRTVSTKSTQLTTENVTSYDCSIAFRNILPRLDPQGTPCNHTEPDAQACSSMPRKGKRKPNTDEDRKKIKLVRRIGACLRCRIFKEAVSCTMSRWQIRANISDSVMKTSLAGDVALLLPTLKFFHYHVIESHWKTSLHFGLEIPGPEKLARSQYLLDGPVMT